MSPPAVLEPPPHQAAPTHAHTPSYALPRGQPTVHRRFDAVSHLPTPPNPSQTKEHTAAEAEALGLHLLPDSGPIPAEIPPEDAPVDHAYVYREYGLTPTQAELAFEHLIAETRTEVKAGNFISLDDFIKTL